MRLEKREKEGIRFAISDLDVDVYLFGSRLDNSKRGGDIDLLVVPRSKANRLKLAIEIQKRFFKICEQTLDVIVYKKDDLFCQEVMRHAERINIKAI
jgi:predicted nucleotidyltransferase